MDINAGGAVTVVSSVTLKDSSFSVAGSTLVVANGRLGLGIAPSSSYPAFTILNASGDSPESKIAIQNNGLAINGTMGLYLMNQTGSAPTGANANGSIDLIYRGGVNYLRLNTNTDGSTPVEAVTIDQAGQVGIGDTTPDYALDVVGDVATSGYFRGSGQYLTGLPASGVTASTFTLVLHSGGDVFVSSGSFAPNLGMTHVFDYSTVTVTGVKCYTLYTSTTNSTYFNIARSSDTGNFSGWDYMFSNRIEVSTNAKYTTDWVVPTGTALFSALPTAVSLHVTGVPTTGTLPQEYGCVIRYWRRLE
jgi:hypothetical protein